MSFWDDVSSMWGGGNAKKAAKENAKAIREQTRSTTMQAGYAAEAAANQIKITGQADAASEYARTLLGRPAETVNVRLAPQEPEVTGGDRTKRLRSQRDRYTTWFGGSDGTA